MGLIDWPRPLVTSGDLWCAMLGWGSNRTILPLTWERRDGSLLLAPYYLLLTTCSLLLAPYSQLLTTNYLLATTYSQLLTLLTTCYLLATTYQYHQLLTSNFLRLTTHY